MDKITAVENLKRAFYVNAEPSFQREDYWLISENDIERLFKQALENEKQQIIDANWESSEDTDRAEQYYIKKFKK